MPVPVLAVRLVAGPAGPDRDLVGVAGVQLAEALPAPGAVKGLGEAERWGQKKHQTRMIQIIL